VASRSAGKDSRRCLSAQDVDLGACPCASANGERRNRPEGMIWIPGGEFDMGAIVNGAQLRDGDAFE
jgi:formylglycine-generating enzyme required for sulfatase activity